MQNFSIRIGLGQLLHGIQVPGRESAQARVAGPDVSGQVGYEGAASFLVLGDEVTYVPVEQHQFSIGGHHRSVAGSADPSLDLIDY